MSTQQRYMHCSHTHPFKSTQVNVKVYYSLNKTRLLNTWI